MVMRALIVLCIACPFCAASEGELVNGGFEIPDPNRATAWFTPPRHWLWYDTPANLNYVGLHTEFVPNPEPFRPVAWSIPGPVEGDFFVLLSTGDAEGPGTYLKTLYSSIEQVISICPGDILYGYYFFGTTDYMNFNDTGLIMLDPVDPNDGHSPVILAEISVQAVGNYGATDGWQFFRYKFNTEICGDYILYCEVRDIHDRQFKSYLALDGFRICRGIPPLADLNFDCVIDYRDFEILSRAWLADCSDPNVITDPNIPCHLLIPDPNIPHQVIDLDFVLPVSENWLEQYD